MKQLPRGAEPQTLPDHPEWVVFIVGSTMINGANRLKLTEVGRVKAGSAPAAIASAVESGLDKTPGARMAIPTEYLVQHKIKIGFFAIIAN